MGQTEKSDRPPGRSVLPPIADIIRLHAEVRLVPRTDYPETIRTFDFRIMERTLDAECDLRLVRHATAAPLCETLRRFPLRVRETTQLRGDDATRMRTVRRRAG
jgi:hypothetical protein